MEKNKEVKTMVKTALFSAIALTIYVIESLVPMPIAVPGVRLGLANAVVLTAIYLLGKKEAFYVMLIKVILGNMFAGTPMSAIYSLAGSSACWCVMVLLSKVLNKNQMWATSAFGAIAHSTAQIIVASLIMKTGALLYYLCVLTAFSVATGVFTGLCAQFTVKRMEDKKCL